MLRLAFISLEILNCFNTLTWKHIFRKKKIFFKTLKYHFLVESIKTKTQYFLAKLPCPKRISKQRELVMQHGPKRKSRVFPVN